MTRRWNWSLWTGFILVLAALFSYPLVINLAIGRGFPWFTLSVFAAGAVLLVAGLLRAFRQPELYRGKIVGLLFAIFSLAMFGFFAYGVFYAARQLPRSAGAPRAGNQAPGFDLPDQNGKQLALSDLLSSPGTRAAVLIFYRGYW